MAKSSDSEIRIAGCDLGKSAAKFVIARSPASGGFEIESTEVVEHEGRAVEAFVEWYNANDVASCAALGATGVYSDRLVAPVLSGFPEDACMEAALPHIPEIGPEGAANIVSIGARGYSVLVRDARGDAQFVENDKCSSGTGETMVRIAGRFGLSIEEADSAAVESDEAIPITARCSVFAKSEMTHFGNQGKPAPALFKGYFGSIAKYVGALLSRAQVEGDVYAVGGCARIQTIVDSLAEHVGSEVTVPELALYVEALGAASLASEQARGQSLAPLPADPSELLTEVRARFITLTPASKNKGRVTRMEDIPVAEGAARRPSVLGVDLGSTGSKIVLTDLETGDPVADIYDRTRGNPVDALQRMITTLLAEEEPDVRAIALTGSGREAAATVLRAAYPEAADRILTLNEIVAHATAAIRCDEQQGESLSIVEIGGQDAKFIQVLGGRIVESDMNKACSAGTGSFLEEQSILYGVDEISDFTKLAKTACNPPDLGQMCTVFVAEAAADARNEGYEISDLFSGFEHSVVHNYINRVMGQRSFGKRIFFQGKPASSESLAWTLASITGREVVVPPNPGAMGGWGIGLCAIDAVGSEALADASRFDLAKVLEAEVVERSEFQCRDKRCATLCSIEKTRVAVGGNEETVLSGGSCPRYENTSATKSKLPIEAPSGFDERDALLRELVEVPAGDDAAEEGDDRPIIGIPAVGALAGWLPWVTTFVSELGMRPVVLWPEAATLSRGEERCYSYDSCAPVKVAHGVIDGEVERVFFPKVLNVGDRDECDGVTCPMEQAQPEMVRESLGARGSEVEIVSPPLWLADEMRTLRVQDRLMDAARRLAGSRVKLSQVAHARHLAKVAQQQYEASLAEIGQRTLDWGREHGVPVVPVCGPLHVIHDPVVNAGIPKLLRENGALALPMDCYPIGDEVPALPRIPWSDALRSLRVAIASRMRGDAYPLLISSFGCGPNSFIEQLFPALLEGHPHTTLESDGHGGTAGYTTRVQAFLYAAGRHDGAGSEPPEGRLTMFQELPNPPVKSQRDKQHVIFTFSDWFSPMIAASYRSHGVDAVASGPNNSDSLRLGRRDCSGKECLPYQLMWGSFRRHLEAKEAAGDEAESVLIQLTGEGACRNCMFSIKDQLSLERAGLAEKVDVRDLQLERDLGITFAQRLVTALTTWDILFQLRAYYRPLELFDGEVDELYREFCIRLESVTEKRQHGGLMNVVTGSLDNVRETFDLLSDASAAFAEIGKRAEGRTDLRTVLLSGDIYLRIDEFAGDQIIRRLNERGVLVAVEPALTLTEYMAHEQVNELARTSEKAGPMAGIVSEAIKLLRTSLYNRARKEHPWMPSGEIAPIVEESRTILERYPVGEAPVTIGSVMHYWHEGMCDGVVLVSPWGCGPALVSESMLKHQREVPMLFVYGDGTPIDERRLNAFVFRLQRSEPRTGAPVAETLVAT